MFKRSKQRKWGVAFIGHQSRRVARKIVELTGRSQGCGCPIGFPRPPPMFVVTLLYLSPTVSNKQASNVSACRVIVPWSNCPLTACGRPLWCWWNRSAGLWRWPPLVHDFPGCHNDGNHRIEQRLNRRHEFGRRDRGGLAHEVVVDVTRRMNRRTNHHLFAVAQDVDNRTPFATRFVAEWLVDNLAFNSIEPMGSRVARSPNYATGWWQVLGGQLPRQNMVQIDASQLASKDDPDVPPPAKMIRCVILGTNKQRPIFYPRPFASGRNRYGQISLSDVGLCRVNCKIVVHIVFFLPNFLVPHMLRLLRENGPRHSSCPRCDQGATPWPICETTV